MKSGRSVKYALICLMLLAIAALSTYILSTQQSSTDGETYFNSGHVDITINTTKISAERAVTPQEKQQGLCCRDFLAADTGMLFIYDQPGIYKFWMKDTRIPLDMYWINSEKKITYIEKNVLPETYPQNFGPDTPSQYILETNAGFADKHNIKVGDPVNF